LQANEPSPRQVGPHLRPSLAEIGGRVVGCSQITAYFEEAKKKPELLTRAQLESLKKPNTKLLQEWTDLISQSTSFTRGEITNPSVFDQIKALEDLSLMSIELTAREAKKSEELIPVRTDAQLWINMAADLAYNEASRQGLIMAAHLRDPILNELEKMVSQKASLMAQSQQQGDWPSWFLSLRIPWPVDRMFLTEARQTLHPVSLNLAEKIAAKIQKNPYLSVEAAIRQIPGGKPHEVMALTNLWQESDMILMKTEMNQVQKMRLQVVSQVFLKRNGHLPGSVHELVSAHLLAQQPIDYFTGLPLGLPQVDMTLSGQKSP